MVTGLFVILSIRRRGTGVEALVTLFQLRREDFLVCSVACLTPPAFFALLVMAATRHETGSGGQGTLGRHPHPTQRRQG